MMSKAFLALALLGAGFVPGFASPDVPDAVVDEALGMDETCGTEGEEAATCALNALQLKAQQLAAEGKEDEQDACHSGLVGQIRSYAPGCIDACSSSCGALGNAVSAYLTRGGQPAAKSAVCKEKGAFSCFMQGNVIGQCQSLISSAAKFGFQLPTSMGALNSQCR